jgi:spore coat protein CotH
MIMSTRCLLAAAAAAALLSLDAAGARAQTAADLFNDQVLHRVDLYVNTRDLHQLVENYTTNDYYPADMKWQNLKVRNVGIRSRGFGSRSQTKLGLLVVFDRYTTGQRFLGMQALVLKNLTQDPSFIREATAMKFLRTMGISAPRESFAVVYINNTYSGVYALVEDVNEVSLPQFVGENDGCLFEYRWLFNYYFDYLGSDLTQYAPLFAPRTRETESLQALYGPIEAMVRTMNDAADADFVPAVSQYLDLNLFVRHVAVQDFVAENDGILGYAGLNNFYLYRFTGTTLHQFIPWDKDNTFISIGYGILQGHSENVLMRRAMQVPALQELYFSTLIDSANLADRIDPGTTQGWLEREMLREQALIGDSVLSDGRKPFTNDEFSAASSFMIQFAQQRSRFVRCEVARERGQPCQ